MDVRIRKAVLHRDFGVFWAGQTLSALGDAFAFVALPLLVLEATGSVRHMGLLTATFGGAHVVAGVFSGAVVDAVDRRRLMIACDAGRALLYATIPLTWALAGPSVPLLYIVTALGSVLGNFFSVAYITATPNLVHPFELTEANSRLQGSQNLAFVLGPALAGVMAAKLGPASALGINAASYVVSCISLLIIRLRRDGARERERGPTLARLSAGMAFLLRQPVLRSVTVLLLVACALESGAFDLFIYLVKHDYGGGDDVVGWVVGTGAVGGVVGALAASHLRKRFAFGAIFLGAMLVEAAGLLAVGAVRSLPGVMFGAVVFSGALVVRGVSTVTLRQRITPDALLGRVTAAFWTLIGTMTPVGAALSTAAVSVVGTRQVIGSCAILIAFVALMGTITAIRDDASPERAT